jgi:8-oxo-dGTP pyrophosphatase MutT (NUDIX family)
MGKKMLVALMMEGKFSGEGLQSLDADEDLMSAMARELVEKAGVGESADAIWRELDHEREKFQPPAAVEQPDLREELQTQLPAETESEPISTLDFATPPPPVFGIHLVEPDPAAKTRKKKVPWPNAGQDVQLKLFG